MITSPEGPAAGDDPLGRGQPRPARTERRAGADRRSRRRSRSALCRFFTANIRNPHTRRAYARACNRFFGWCEDCGLAPSVKQQLADVRMVFDWLVIGQVVPTNPAAAVRGPKHVVKTGKTPVLEGAEWRKLLKSIPDTTLRDLRDRALIATLTYGFAGSTRP